MRTLITLVLEKERRHDTTRHDTIRYESYKCFTWSVYYTVQC